MSRLPDSIRGTGAERRLERARRRRNKGLADGTVPRQEATYFPDDPGDADLVVGSAIGPNNALVVSLDIKAQERTEEAQKKEQERQAFLKRYLGETGCTPPPETT